MVTVKYLAAIAYIFATFTLFLAKTVPIGMFDPFDGICFGIVPVVFYLIITVVFDSFSQKSTIIERRLIYTLPVLFPLFFKVFHCYLSNAAFFTPLDEVDRGELIYFTIVFILNVLLILIALKKPRPKNLSERFAEPVYSDSDVGQ